MKNSIALLLALCLTLLCGCSASNSTDPISAGESGSELPTAVRDIPTDAPAAIEIAPMRTDTALDDFFGVWQAEMLCLNGIILEADGTVLSPSVFGADMSVFIGTVSAAVETAAEPNITYIFPLSFSDGILTMTLEDMVMTAQLHEDGMMSISGSTPLHRTVFTEDAPLMLYMSLEKEESE